MDLASLNLLGHFNTEEIKAKIAGRAEGGLDLSAYRLRQEQADAIIIFITLNNKVKIGGDINFGSIKTLPSEYRGQAFEPLAGIRARDIYLSTVTTFPAGTLKGAKFRDLNVTRLASAGDSSLYGVTSDNGLKLNQLTGVGKGVLKKAHIHGSVRCEQLQVVGQHFLENATVRGAVEFRDAQTFEEYVLCNAVVFGRVDAPNVSRLKQCALYRLFSRGAHLPKVTKMGQHVMRKLCSVELLHLNLNSRACVGEGVLAEAYCTEVKSRRNALKDKENREIQLSSLDLRNECHFNHIYQSFSVGRILTEPHLLGPLGFFWDCDGAEVLKRFKAKFEILKYMRIRLVSRPFGQRCVISAHLPPEVILCIFYYLLASELSPVIDLFMMKKDVECLDWLGAPIAKAPKKVQALPVKALIQGIEDSIEMPAPKETLQWTDDSDRYSADY